MQINDTQNTPLFREVLNFVGNTVNIYLAQPTQWRLLLFLNIHAKCKYLKSRVGSYFTVQYHLGSILLNVVNLNFIVKCWQIRTLNNHFVSIQATVNNTSHITCI